MRRACCLIAALCLVSTVSAAGGIDPYGMRQTAGVFITVDGKTLSVFLDFESLKHLEGERQSVPLNLDADLDTWIEGHKVPAGRHRWTFETDGDSMWTVGEKQQKGKDSKRFLLLVEKSRQSVPYLTCAFLPDPERGSIILKLQFGRHEGTLKLQLKKEQGETVEVASMDLVELRALRDRLRETAGIFGGVRRDRHGWSSFLLDLGQALHDGECGGFLSEVVFKQDAKQVSLTVKGLMPGGRGGVDALGETLSRGELSHLFEKVGLPIAQLKDRSMGWSFEITAEATRKWWDRAEHVPALSKGVDPVEIAEEILLLEARLAKETRGAVANLADFRTRLLKAKRDAGVLISKIEPGSREQWDGGVASFEVEFTVSGAGSSILRFVREIEDWDAPLRLVPLTLSHGDFGPMAVIRVVFFTYASLESRRPKLHAAVREKGMGPEFAKNRDVYLRSVGQRETFPFIAPVWTKDPFELPRDDE